MARQLKEVSPRRQDKDEGNEEVYKKKRNMSL